MICYPNPSSLFSSHIFTRYYHALRLLKPFTGFAYKMTAQGIVPRSLPLPVPGMASRFSGAVSPSPTPTELRDDVGALLSEFKKRTSKSAFRRRLSTSFDIPPGISAPGDKDKANKEKEPDEAQKEIILERFLKSHVADVEATVEEEKVSESPTLSPTFSSDDLFALLSKVIGFRGRNASQISVERTVKDLCTCYDGAPSHVKIEFFKKIVSDYGVDYETVCSLAKNFIATEDSRTNLEEKLRNALVPRYHWIFSQMGRLENGVKFLVDLRADLLEGIEKQTDSATISQLKLVSNSLRDLLGMWFGVGFLDLQRVTWQSSCDMLQKISEYEAVHPVRNWTDLKRRVGPYRRCFVFTHGSMPAEPVVVLHTALTNQIPASIRTIVQTKRAMSLGTELHGTCVAEDPNLIDTAVFYSITSTQKGLLGIELGNYLIKRVVRELQSEFPKMSKFSSLSPIPGFRNWLREEIKKELKAEEGSSKLFTSSEISAFMKIFDTNCENTVCEKILSLLKLNEWFENESLKKELETPFMRLCAHYLFVVKRRGYALNPVAHFHLKNGAVMWRLNWLADTSAKGLTQSCGIMVNYRYMLEDCEKNSQRYLEEREIQTSDQVRHLVKMSLGT